MPRISIPNQEDEAVTFKTCKTMQDGCKTNWKYIIGGIVGAGILSLGALYTLQESTSSALANTREEMAGQKQAIKNIDERTLEMQRDIKELLQRR